MDGEWMDGWGYEWILDTNGEWWFLNYGEWVEVVDGNGVVNGLMVVDGLMVVNSFWGVETERLTIHKKCHKDEKSNWWVMVGWVIDLRLDDIWVTT